VDEEGRAVGANDLIVGAHVEVDVGMIHRWPCAHTLKLFDSDVYFFDPNIVVKVGNADFRHTSPPVHCAAERYPKERALQVVTCLPRQNAAPWPIVFGLKQLFDATPMLRVQPHMPLGAHPLPFPNGALFLFIGHTPLPS
jgi:hypothetical protein